MYSMLWGFGCLALREELIGCSLGRLPCSFSQEYLLAFGGLAEIAFRRGEVTSLADLVIELNSEWF